ncbi:Low affinity iron permease-domain-containing protein [Dactylonectria estremocensis]|uniref:Low affinity iron permease-domain-containing protein n=1 Tax=Dactylonectria estremocensis TaxID=1079267 RepID=A0A9P9DAL8_9HYPO|nr:Low affinity iron permease-domain-containing protein [Dactylonectria estremocensis]
MLFEPLGQRARSPWPHPRKTSMFLPLDEKYGDIHALGLEPVVSGDNTTGFVPKAKIRLLDRGLDVVVRFAGSEPVFLSLMTGLLVWAFLGIWFGHSMQWAVIISNIQAILSYIFDSFLMRQQLNEYERDIRAAAMLRSRIHSQKRMVREIVASSRYRLPAANELSLKMDDVNLPAEKWLGRVSTFLSAILGHIVTVGLFWLGVFVWIGFGHSLGWSDQWQLYINSATSALMLLIFAFLTNIHERHGAHIEKCLDTLFEVDSAIEARLRTLTGDITPNPVVTVPAPKVGRLQRAIFYYADVVGTLVGIAILITVLIAWLAVGPLMSFNSNWWLLIGTYAGLVGMNDGFVLDNVQSRLNSYVDDAFEQVIFDDLYTPEKAENPGQKVTISQRLSVKINRICSHPATVVIGFLAIIGLLVGATAMEWTMTGQLLCNVPPSIIESFFMMILITSHNMSDDKRRADLQAIYLH